MEKYKLKTVLPIVAAIASLLSLVYLGSGAYFTMLPAGDSLLSRAGTVVGGDFTAFYGAGRMVGAGDYPAIYDRRKYSAATGEAAGADKPYSWSYPPVALLYVAPLGALSFLTALILWTCLPLSALAWLFHRIAGDMKIAAFVLVSPPLAQNILAGQTGAIAAAIVGTGLWLLPGQPLLAGAVLALAVFKPHLAMILPICLVAGGHIRAAAGMAMGGALLALASLAVFGVDTWLAFLAHLGPHMDLVTGNVLRQDRIPTVFALVMRLAEDETLARVCQGVVSVAVIAGAALAWRFSRDAALRALVLVAATMLATPYAFSYDYALMAVPLILAVRKVGAGAFDAADIAAIAAMWLAPLAIFLVDGAAGLAIVGMLLFYGYRSIRAGYRSAASSG